MSLQTDSKGTETKKRYTLRGQLAEINYPDGSSETKRYDFSGALIETTAKNGTRTHFTNDALGRPTLVETYAPSGKLLTTVSTTYSGFHPLSEIDPMELPQHIPIRLKGRLNSRQKGDSLTTYSYDTFGKAHKDL